MSGVEMSLNESDLDNETENTSDIQNQVNSEEEYIEERKPCKAVELVIDSNKKLIKKSNKKIDRVNTNVQKKFYVSTDNRQKQSIKKVC